MGLTRNQRSAKKRKWLIEQLGGKCAIPGCDAENLELDHIIPIWWEPSMYSSNHRLSEYLRAYSQKNLQILCGKHHAQKTRHDHEDRDGLFGPEKEPF